MDFFVKFITGRIHSEHSSSLNRYGPIQQIQMNINKKGAAQTGAALCSRHVIQNLASSMD